MNSRRWEDKVLRATYRARHPDCELYALCKHLGVFLSASQTRHRKVQATEVHHIFHAGKVRLDVQSNLIHLCHQIHGMDSICGKELRVACLWLKWKKSLKDPKEFVVADLNRAAGAVRPDARPMLSWLETHRMCHEAFVPMHTKLLEVLSGKPVVIPDKRLRPRFGAQTGCGPTEDEGTDFGRVEWDSEEDCVP